MWLRAAAVALVVGGAGSGLAACASSTTPGPATSSAASLSLTSAPSSALLSLSAGPVPSQLPGVPSAGAGTEVTLTGTVREGVEASCLLLADDSGTVLANLLGNDGPELAVGARVEVTGSFLEGVMTTCQQGLPFQVTAVKAL